MELITKKDYTLLSEASYFDAKGELKKTKEVTLYCLKICDAEEVENTLYSGKRLKALEFLCSKGYITPANLDGKIKISDFDYRSSVVLLEEYAASFLDFSPFLPKKENGENLES
jgi:hypothetical protein